MVSILLFLKFFKKLQKLQIHIVSFLILSFHCTSFTESQNVNGYSVIEHDISNELRYDNSADIKFITNINKWDFYYFPIYPYHNNSALGITLLDTYGDYFNVYIDYDEHLFYYEKKICFSQTIKMVTSLISVNFFLNTFQLFLLLYCIFPLCFILLKKEIYCLLFKPFNWNIYSCT